MYRLWVHIEEIDASGEPCGDVIEPIDLGDFDTQKAAEAHVHRMIELESPRSTDPARSPMAPALPDRSEPVS